MAEDVKVATKFIETNNAVLARSTLGNANAVNSVAYVLGPARLAGMLTTYTGSAPS